MRMHRDGIAYSSAVEPTEVTLRIVKAHQTMDRRDLSERGIYRPMGRVRSQALNANAHQCSKPGLGAFNGLGSTV